MNEPKTFEPVCLRPGTSEYPAHFGISQRRLLAGMILSGWLSGNYANQNSEPWTVEGAVYESLKYADELIKQTEET